MFAARMTKIARRGPVRLLLWPLAQLMLLGHLLLDEHEDGASCEVCQHAHKAKISFAPSAQSFFNQLVFFVGIHTLAGPVLGNAHVRRYAARAPPQ